MPLPDAEKERLKELAKKATQGERVYARDDEGSSMGWIEVLRPDLPGLPLFDVRGDSAQAYMDAEFAAAASPSTVTALLEELEELKAERDGLKAVMDGSFQLEELHMVNGQTDAQVKAHPRIVMLFAEAWMHVFKGAGAKNFVCMGLTHHEEGAFEIIMRKSFSESPELVAGKAVARAVAAEAERDRMRQALEFYADPDTYEQVELLGNCPLRTDSDQEGFGEYGMRARAVLAPKETAPIFDLHAPDFKLKGSEAEAALTEKGVTP